MAVNINTIEGTEVLNVNDDIQGSHAITINALKTFIGTGVTDHGALTGLSDDDHSQYLLLAGRAGGQTTIGGTAASNNLTLSSTSNATKGAIIFGASRYDEATNRLVLGTSTGTGKINLPDGGTTAADGIQFGTGSSNLYRSGANTLTTGGAFTVLGQFSTSGDTYLRSGTFGILSTGASINGNAITGSSSNSLFSLSQTWNTTGNPTLIFANVTNTASGANASLIDLQVGGVSAFRVAKNGALSTTNETSLFNGTLFVQSNNVITYRQSIGFFGTPVTSAMVEMRSTTQGFLPPRMTVAQRDLIASPVAGLTVYCTDATATDTSTGVMQTYNGTTWKNNW